MDILDAFSFLIIICCVSGNNKNNINVSSSIQQWILGHFDFNVSDYGMIAGYNEEFDENTIIILGGYNYQLNKYIYDIPTQTIIMQSNAINLNIFSGYQSYITLNHSIYYSSGTQELYIYNMLTSTVAPTLKSKLYSAYGDCITSDLNNYIYLIGGEGYVGCCISIYKHLQIYNIHQNTWTLGHELVNSRDHASCTYWNNNLYLFGGHNNANGNNYNDIQMLQDINGINSSWIVISATLTSTVASTYAFVDNTHQTAFIIGGSITWWPSGVFCNKFDLIDQSIENCQHLMNIPRLDFATIYSSYYSTVYVFGGASTNDRTQLLNSVEYAVVTDSPIMDPTIYPSNQPTISPTSNPSKIPTNEPSINPTMNPNYITTTSLTLNVETSSIVLNKTIVQTNMHQTVQIGILTLLLQSIVGSLSFLMIIVGILAYVHSKKQDYSFKIWNILVFCFHFMDLSTDLIFSFVLFNDYKHSNNDSIFLYMFILSLMLIFLSAILSLYHLNISIKRWIIECDSSVSLWLEDYGGFLYFICLMVGSCQSAVNLCTSNLFGLEIFNLKLSKEYKMKLNNKHICSSIICENAPQLLLEIFYVIYTHSLNDITLFALIFSSASIIMAPFTFVTRRQLLHQRQYTELTQTPYTKMHD